MRKIILFVLLAGPALAYGQETMSFATVIASPWGVASTVTIDPIMTETESNSLPPDLTTLNSRGPIMLNGRNITANLGAVELENNATLKQLQDTNPSQRMTWTLTNPDRDNIQVGQDGSLSVRNFGTADRLNTLQILPNSLVVVLPEDNDNTATDASTTGTLNFNSSPTITIDALSTMKVNVGDTTWYDYTLDESGKITAPSEQTTLKWEQCLGDRDIKCGGVVFTGVEKGDFVLMGQ